MAETVKNPTAAKQQTPVKDTGKTQPSNGDTAKPARDKAAKFREIANLRVPKVQKALRNIGNLANRASYEYTAEQAGKLVEVLQNELNHVKQRFAGSNATAVPDKLF